MLLRLVNGMSIRLKVAALLVGWFLGGCLQVAPKPVYHPLSKHDYFKERW